MSAETLSKPAGTAPAPPGEQASGRRRRKWVPIVIAAIVGVVLIAGGAAAIVIVNRSNAETGPALTHVITRGELVVTVVEQGTLESSDNTEIKCRVRGQNTVTFVVESGTFVKPGDVLVQLDTLALEEAIAERKKYAHWSRSAAERSKADVARSTLAISEYEQGRFVASLSTLEKDLAVSKANLVTARNMQRHTKSLFERGYRSALDVEEREFAVRQAELDVAVKETDISVLRDFTKREQLETLVGNLKATEARHKADAERAGADASRRDRALEELGYCTVKAERAGLVIYPSAAAWKNAPDIAEGATVHKDQILLLMPDMTKMQVKVGVHESIIDSVREGLPAVVRLSDRTLNAEVTSVASITTPGGWWNGNKVEYDTIIKLPSVERLKPGMSAEVEIVLARHKDVLKIPVAAVVETEKGSFCWVITDAGPQRRKIELGDNNGIFIEVTSGVREGDEVALNPIAFVEDAKSEVLKPATGKRDMDRPEQSAAKEAGTPEGTAGSSP